MIESYNIKQKIMLGAILIPPAIGWVAAIMIGRNDKQSRSK